MAPPAARQEAGEGAGEGVGEGETQSDQVGQPGSEAAPAPPAVTSEPTASPGSAPSARSPRTPSRTPARPARTGTARTGTARTGTARTGTARTGTARGGTAPAGTGRNGTAGTGPADTGPADAGAVTTTGRPPAQRGRGLPRTLSFDIGGTGLKASVLSRDGELLHTPVRTPTPYPLRPEHLVSVLVELTGGLPAYQRVSAGFPGMVREGRLLSAPHFISPAGPGGKPSLELEKAWADFELQDALATALGKPCRVANDADVQGAALVKGEGLEFVITLGTGVGTAMFWKGKLAPHIELAHHPLGKGGRNYNEVLGEAARQKVGNKKWNTRVASMLDIVRDLVFYDHCYVGGGNSTKVKIDLPPDVSLASNAAGILGGIKLWERL
jgi:polyphosphate glucokinase